MATESQEPENVADTTTTTEGDEKKHLVLGDETTLSDDPTSSEDGSSTSDDAFDAPSYEQSFGLPTGTLDGVEDAEGALEAIRGYTDETLTAGLLSNSIAGVTPATAAGEGDSKSDAAVKLLNEAVKKESGNTELDALRAGLAEVKESLAIREKIDHDTRVAEINRRVDSEIDVWASPKYGTTKSRNFKQAKAMKELQELVETHIAGSNAQGKSPPIVESLLRQVRTFHDDEYKPAPVKKNSDAALGSPGTGSRSTKGDDGPSNIHEALMGNSY